MKYIITEGQYKKLLKKHLGLDLTGNVKMITSSNDLPDGFSFFAPIGAIRQLLNRYGPMYTIKTIDNKFLLQPRKEDRWSIEDLRGVQYGKQQFLDYLGLTYLGITIDELIDEFLEKDFDE